MHRYPKFRQDASHCQHGQQLWEQMKQADDRQLEQIVSRLEQHVGGTSDRAAA